MLGMPSKLRRAMLQSVCGSVPAPQDAGLIALKRAHWAQTHTHAEARSAAAVDFRLVMLTVENV